MRRFMPKKPATIEPFHIVRARRIRNARLRRLALGLALGGVIFLGGGLAGCAEARPGPPQIAEPGADPRYDEAGLTLAGFSGPVVVVFSAPSEVSRRGRAAGSFGSPEACTQRAGLTCTINMAPPRSARDVRSFAVWRHELLHCKYGDWHD